MNSKEILEAITRPENLFWAWQKVKSYYLTEAAWRDEIEISSFEINLRKELNSIAESFTTGSYAPSLIRPIPQPKKKDVDGIHELRQLFWIPVKDQVAWISVVNIIGPLIDSTMPTWSFGNRLYRARWSIEEDVNNQIIKTAQFGPYRHTNGMLYKRFSESWPRYRRSIYLTLRKMAHKNHKDFYFELEEAEQHLMELEENSEELMSLPYLKKDFWDNESKDIYWASLDFKKFYPNLKLKVILNILSEKLNLESYDQFYQLIYQMIDFRIDYSDEHIDYGLIELKDKPKVFDSIPTGLMVGGFLANVAMLKIDQSISEKIKQSQVAHFRYVDDHIVLARSFESLVNWIKEYISLLSIDNIASLNLTKTVPEELKDYLLANNLDSKDDLYIKAQNACLIDPVYPKPLMTKTLARVSQLARVNFEFMEDSEQKATLNDLELLLLADISDSELPEATRISFAATLLSRFSALLNSSSQNTLDISDLNRELYYLKSKQAKINSKWLNTIEGDDKIKLGIELSELSSKIEMATLFFAATSKEINQSRENRFRKTFILLIKAIHENPEKLRLWQRANDFCMATGYKGLSKIQDELTNFHKTSNACGQYVEALLLNDLSTKLAKTYGDLQFGSLSSLQKDKALIFVTDAIETFDKWPTTVYKPYFLKVSFQLLYLTLTSFEKLFSITLDPDKLPHGVKDKLIKIREYPSQENWTRDDYIAAHTPWLWWIDSLAIPFSGCDPSIAWLEESKQLDPYFDSTWTIWQKHPNSLPENAINMIKSGHKVFSEGYEGWLLDVFYDLEWAQLQDTSELTTPIKNLIGTLSYPEGVSLIEWNVWSKKKEALSLDFDPRQSEWTALEIISQVISSLSSYEEHIKFRDFPIHPANIVVPRTWLELYDEDSFVNGIPPWEFWRNLTRVEENRVQLSSKDSLIHDYRFYPETQDNLIFDTSWMKVRGLGMILLGLLRRSFKWPAIWNLPDHSPLFDRSVRQLIGEINCSSLTSGILESCLLPRSRETLLIPLLQAQIKKNSDTTYHPPQISSISDLKTHIDDAQKVLEDYQFSVRANQPRQLIPLRIEQLPRFGDELAQIQEPLND